MREIRERLKDMKGVKHVSEIKVTIDPKEGIISHIMMEMVLRLQV